MVKSLCRVDPGSLFLLLVTMASLLFCEAAFSMGMSFGVAPEPTSTAELQVSPGPLVSPVGIYPVYSPQGLSSLLVTDAGKRTVNKISFRHPDAVEELFNVDGIPLGIAKFRRRIYVGNRSKGSVDVYLKSDEKYRLLRRIKTDMPMQPNDIAIDAQARQLIVADGLANNVKVFTLSGRLVRAIDGFGDLFEPKSVAVDAQTGVIAVTDCGDMQTGIPASVQLYDASGAQLLRKTGMFSAPQGVALSADRLFVADALLGQVMVLNRSDGTLLGTYGSFGTDPGQLVFPLDLVFVEQTATLYVVNNRMGRIMTYSPADFQPLEVLP